MDLRPSASTGSGNGENIQVQGRKRNEERPSKRWPSSNRSNHQPSWLSRWSAQSKTVTVCTVTSAVASSDGDRRVCASPDMHIAIFSSFLTLSNTEHRVTRETWEKVVHGSNRPQDVFILASHAPKLSRPSWMFPAKGRVGAVRSEVIVRSMGDTPTVRNATPRDGRNGLMLTSSCLLSTSCLAYVDDCLARFALPRWMGIAFGASFSAEVLGVL